MKRRLHSVGTFVLVVVMIACQSGLISGFKAGFASTKPFIQVLVTQHVIDQTKATAAIADVDDSLNFASVAQGCLEGATDKPAKAQCYLTLANNLRTVLQRHNIGTVEGNTQLDRIATIAEAAILAFQNYFNRVVPRPGVRASSKVDPDAQLKADLEAVRADLKALTGK